MVGQKISIITISYNSEKTIEKTFQSILKQSYRPLEYVLVDGGSTDSTIELIEKYIPLFKSEGIEISYKSERDKGISDAFNKGITRATGDIIGIINSDDQLSDKALEKVGKAFAENDVGVVCGDCLWEDKANNLSYVRKSKMNLKKLTALIVAVICSFSVLSGCSSSSSENSSSASSSSSGSSSRRSSSSNSSERGSSSSRR